FFQAEDGIRDRNVTGVQSVLFRSSRVKVARLNRGNDGGLNVAGTVRGLLRVVQQDAVHGHLVARLPRLLRLLRGLTLDKPHLGEIGRASCRERMVSNVACAFISET